MIKLLEDQISIKRQEIFRSIAYVAIRLMVVSYGYYHFGWNMAVLLVFVYWSVSLKERYG